MIKTLRIAGREITLSYDRTFPTKRVASISVEQAVRDVRLRQINNELDVLATSTLGDMHLSSKGYDLQDELRKMPRSGHRDAALLRVLTICFKFPIGSAHRILDGWNAEDVRSWCRSSHTSHPSASWLRQLAEHGAHTRQESEA